MASTATLTARVATVAAPEPPVAARPAPVYAVRGMFAIVLLATLKIAAPLLVPIALAVFLSLMLSPVARFLECKARLPRPVAAGIVTAGVIAAIVSALISLAEPALKWSKDLPNLMPQVEEKLSVVKEPIAEIGTIAEKVQDLTEIDEPKKKRTAEVVISTPGAIEKLMAEAPYAVTATGIMLFLTFFLLLCGGDIVRRIAALGPRFGHRRRIVRTLQSMQGDITRFLFTISVINAALGAVTGITLHFLGVPNPILWGVVVALCNFAPYVGPAIALVLLAGVGLMSMETFASAAVVPLSFLVLTSLEGHIVTPLIVGRRLDLSPLVVFLSVIVWGYIWGLAGALMAVPIVASFKLLLASMPSARPFARLMSR